MNPRENRDSPPYELKWQVCRECRRIQSCVVLRGWYVCRKCLEEQDREFCERRALEMEEKWRRERGG